MAVRTDLADVNVWLALTLPDHPHHLRAVQFWNTEAAERIAFCRLTSLSFLRLCGNRTVMGGQPLTVTEAWSAYQALRQLPEVVLLEETDSCETMLAAWASEGLFSIGHWTDAYLAAFAKSGGSRLVSFDSDFSRFEGLAFLHLRPRITSA